MVNSGQLDLSGHQLAVFALKYVDKFIVHAAATGGPINRTLLRI